MHRLRIAALVALAMLACAGAAEAATPKAVPLLACGARQVYKDRTFKVFATDAIQQSWRYYLRVSWCAKPTVVPPGIKITRVVTSAWGECGACGAWNFEKNLEGPIIGTELPSPSVPIYARGSFAYMFPPWIGAIAGHSMPWIQVTLTGVSYSCTGGRTGGKLGAVFHGCVTA